MIDIREAAIEQEREGFCITDDHLAEWAINKIKEAQSDTEMWKQHFAAQLQSIANNNQNTINYMTSLLGSYFITVPHRETATQAKYELPSATLIRKRQQPEYDVDDQTLLSYLFDGGRTDYIKTVQSPKWGEFKKITTINGNQLIDNETGEVVRGVAVAERPDVFDVKIKED